MKFRELIEKVKEGDYEHARINIGDIWKFYEENIKPCEFSDIVTDLMVLGKCLEKSFDDRDDPNRSLQDCMLIITHFMHKNRDIIERLLRCPEIDIVLA